jgi:hypothetical protein
MKSIPGNGGHVVAGRHEELEVLLEVQVGEPRQKYFGVLKK